MREKANNIDKKCAKYGFDICSYLDTIENKINGLLEEVDSINLVEIVEKVKNELNGIHQFNEFNTYVKTSELEKLEQIAEKIQKNSLVNEEKIEKFFKACKNTISTSAKEYENAIRKTLGILTNDGIFATIVWIESNEGDGEYRAIKYQTSKFLSEIIGNMFSGNPDNLREEMLNVCNDIHQMFFVKQILEQMLIYALYRARSLR